MKPRLLVFELRMMGDAIMSLPFIRAALERHQVFVCCTASGAPIFERVLPPDQILVWNPPWTSEEKKYAPGKWAASGLGSCLRRLRSIRATTAVTVWADARVHLLMALSGARRRIGFPMSDLNYYASQLPERQKQLRFGRALNAVAGLLLWRPLLTEKINRRDRWQHHVEGWRQLAEALHLNWNASMPWLSAPAGTLAPALADFLGRARRAGRPVWLVHPGARTPNRRWSFQNFSRVIREFFLARGMAVLLIQPAEVPFQEEFGEDVLILGASGLDVFFQALGQVNGVLCNDTGVSHAAAALGKKVVTIFTANLPGWFAPFGNRQFAIEQDSCAFRPCLDQCRMPSFVCRDAITPELVIAMLARPEVAGGGPEIARDLESGIS